MLDNRLEKRMRHLQKWSRRIAAPCFRLYERDIPEFPLVIDWYDGDVLLWFHPRTRDDTPEAETISASGAFVFRVDYQASGQ